MAQRVAVIEKGVEIKCAFCGGTGRDPFKVLSPLSNCGICGGKGGGPRQDGG